MTQQLLPLLTPEERAVAITLLEYAEDSVGRLMTPDYVRSRKDWTVKRVLDHVRPHGKDSETLNVLYVVDDHDRLIDDIRIREFLLAPPTPTSATSWTPVRRPQGHRRRGVGRRCVPEIRPHRLARSTDPGRPRGHRHDRRRARRGRRGRPPGTLQQFGGLEALDEPYIDTPSPAMVREARQLAGHPVPGRDADGHRDGLLRGGDREGRGPGPVRAAHHLQRRQLGLAGGDAHHPGPGPRARSGSATGGG